MTAEVPPYVSNRPLPNVAPDIQQCFPESGLIHRAMWYLAETSYTSPEHHLAAVIPAIANFMAQRGWETAGRGQQTAVQTLIVGPSGAGKSVALREVMRLVEDADRLYWGAAYSRELHNRWVEAEGTTAGLLELLHDMKVESWDPVTTPGAHWPLEGTPAVLYHEECSSLLGKRDSMLETMLQLFDPKPRVERNLAMYRAMRKRGESAPSVVEKPAVSAVFCTTVAALRGVFNAQHMEGGLMQRFSWTYAEGVDARITVDKPDRSSERLQVARDWAAGLKYWDQWLLDNGGPHRARRVIHLDLPVKRQLERVVADIRLAHQRKEFDTVSTRIRGLNATQALAQIYAWSRGEVTVHPDDLYRAMAFYERSYASVELLRNQLDASFVWQRRTQLLDIIRARGRQGMPRSEMYPALRCTKPELDLLLEQLKDEGSIDRVTVSPSAAKKRGRPIERWASTSSTLRLVHGGESDDAPEAPVAHSEASECAEDAGE